MRRYIITGTLLLGLSMACEEKKKTRSVSAPPPAPEIVLSSPIEIALPSVPSEAPVPDVEATKEKVVEQEKAAEPKMALAAKVVPPSSPIQYEDVSSRVLAEGSRDEAKDVGLAKIREKALLRMKEMQDSETAEVEKIKADEAKAEQIVANEKAAAEAAAKAQETASIPVEAAAATPVEALASPVKENDKVLEDVGSKVAMVAPEEMNTAETQVVSEASKDQTEALEPVAIKKSRLDTKTAKALEIKFRKAREMARVGEVEAAKNLFLTICQAGHAHACHKFAWYEEQAGNTQNATRFYRAACDNGLGKSCNNLAFQFEQIKVYAKALELYAKGCAEKHEASCISVKRIHEEQEQEKANLQTR
ncbi:MAG: sel1 repeat family protein [Oligoflexus sp.]|nr:sel1 repeat family protein [Oligoflexus sp.]